MRNTLVDATSSKSSYPNAEEKREMQERITRTLMNNPSFTMDTAMKVVADGAGLPIATVQRWLTTT
jgi:hypothetical protein